MDEPFVPDDPDDHGAPVGDSDEVLAVGVDAPVVAGGRGPGPPEPVALGHDVEDESSRRRHRGQRRRPADARYIARHRCAHAPGRAFVRRSRPVVGCCRGTRAQASALDSVASACRQPLVLRPPGAADGATGGYHPVLSRVEVPVMTTFSSKDVALHEVFHLALRGRHLGEPDIAAIGDTDLYGALGGYGPSGLDNFDPSRRCAPSGTCAISPFAAYAGHRDQRGSVGERHHSHLGSRRHFDAGNLVGVAQPRGRLSNLVKQRGWTSMAMQLSKKWSLAVLRVRLQVSGRHPAVTSEGATVLGYSHGDEHHHWSQSDAPSDFGIEDSAHAPTSCAFRRICGTRSRRPWRISSTVAQPSRLHLVPPYGIPRGGAVRKTTRREDRRADVCVCPTDCRCPRTLGANGP